jgi:hypothetical protein
MKVNVLWFALGFFFAWPFAAAVGSIAAQQAVPDKTKSEISAREHEWMSAVFDKHDAHHALRKLFPSALIFAPLPVPTINPNAPRNTPYETAYPARSAIEGSDVAYQIDPDTRKVVPAGDGAVVVSDSFTESVTKVNFNNELLKAAVASNPNFVSEAIARIKETYAGRFQQIEVWYREGNTWTLAAAEVSPAAATTHGLDCELKE